MAVVTTPAWLWAVFLVTVAGLLVLDVAVIDRRPRVITMRRAIEESLGWIAVSVAFGAVVWLALGSRSGGEYFAAYLTEKSLSVDNVFVWAVIMGHFAVPRELQHRALLWGVVVALAMRVVMILVGVALLDRFGWTLYVFGGFLLFTAWRLATSDDELDDPAAGPVMRVAARVVPSVPRFEGTSVFVSTSGGRRATTMFFVLVVIGTTDVVFALDSIPAVLALSRSPFVVLASNAFAVLGLRSLYFVFADLRGRFTYLEEGLAVVLAFVGLKMIVEEGIAGWTLQVSTAVSIGVIVVVLGAAVGLSLVTGRHTGPARSGSGGEAER